MLRWPAAGLSGGRVIDELVSNVDVVPTILDALGLPRGPELEGRSVWPLLQGDAYAPRTEVFAEKTFHTYYEPMRAIRTDHHKLIVNFEVSTAVDVPADIRASPIYPLMLPDFNRARPPIELYDLASDPWEQTNLAESPDFAAVRQRPPPTPSAMDARHRRPAPARPHRLALQRRCHALAAQGLTLEQNAESTVVWLARSHAPRFPLTDSLAVLHQRRAVVARRLT